MTTATISVPDLNSLVISQYMGNAAEVTKDAVTANLVGQKLDELINSQYMNDMSKSQDLSDSIIIDGFEKLDASVLSTSKFVAVEKPLSSSELAKEFEEEPVALPLSDWAAAKLPYALSYAKTAMSFVSSATVIIQLSSTILAAPTVCMYVGVALVSAGLLEKSFTGKLDYTKAALGLVTACSGIGFSQFLAQKLTAFCLGGTAAFVLGAKAFDMNSVPGYVLRSMISGVLNRGFAIATIGGCYLFSEKIATRAQASVDVLAEIVKQQAPDYFERYNLDVVKHLFDVSGYCQKAQNAVKNKKTDAMISGIDCVVDYSAGIINNLIGKCGTALNCHGVMQKVGEDFLEKLTFAPVFLVKCVLPVKQAQNSAISIA